MAQQFFEELSRCLRKEQIESYNKEDRRLEIFLHGQPVLSVSPGNEVFLLPAGSKNPEANELYHRVAIAADSAFEYVEAMENTPLLRARGLENKFHLLADFGGAVLAGRERAAGQGYEFVTWIWDYEKVGVSHGHYYEDDFAGAKRDFAVRSGLISNASLFSKEELTELYRATEHLLADDPDLNDKQMKAIQEARTKIEFSVPDLDTKGDLYRNYAGIAKDFYGYQIAVLDLRNPTRSDGNNLLHLINKYMDIYKANPNDLAAKAKAEKYSKILAKTLINTSGGDSAQYGQNAFFYDSAEGLLTAMFLLVAEYLPTEDENGNPVEKRHIVSVFKLVQELLAPSKVKGKNQFQILLEKLPPNHKARWFAGSALNTAEQAMASVISTVLSRLNAFLDSEMEQILCFDTAIDAEKFCNEKSAIFIVLPEEDQTKYFMVSLILQNLYREILTVADENGGRLKNRVVFFADELGTCPPIQSLELMFSASRSRGLMLVPIVQSITGQLKKNYGAEGAEVIVDNCQVNLYGGFAPASQTAVELSKALGSRTVMSGSISRGKNDPSQSLQMIERPLMTPDELKSMPKGSFIVAKTGVHPMKVKLRLFLDWGIRFGEPYEVPEKAQRAVAYADKQELEESIIRRHYGTVAEEEPPQDVPAAVGGMNHGMQAEKNSRKTILRP